MTYREFEQFSPESKDLRNANFTICGGMKGWDIQITLTQMQFDTDLHNFVGIEFQRPWSVGKPNYLTYQAFGNFVHNRTDFLEQYNGYKKYYGKEISAAIKGDFKRWTAYFKLDANKDGILSMTVKGGWYTNQPLEEANHIVTLDLVTDDTKEKYTGNLHKALLITQEELLWMFCFIDTMQRDVKKYPEFTAQL